MDIVEAVRAILLDPQSQVSTLTQVVFDEELDLSQDINMPQKVIIVRAAGGAARYSQGTLQLIDPRLTILSYAETPHLAKSLDTAVYSTLRNAGPGVWFGTYIHWLKPTTLGINMRDPDTQWPYVVSSWEVLASDQPVAA